MAIKTFGVSNTSVVPFTDMAQDVALRGAAKTPERLDAVTARPADTRTLLGKSGPARGRLELQDPRAKAALDACFAHLKALGIDAGSVHVKSVDVDALGMTHVRFDRRHQGVRVFGEQLIVHLKEGEILGTTGNAAVSAIPPDARLGASRISGDAAVKLALAEFNTKPESKPVVERVIFAAPDGSYRLGYRVQVASYAPPDPRRITYLVDGSAKAIVQQWNEIGGIWLPRAPRLPLAGREAPARVMQRSSDAKGDDLSIYSGNVELDTTKVSDKEYTLLDTTRGGGVHTRDAQNRSRPTSPVDIKDNDDSWGQRGDSSRQNGAVDAHFGMAATYDMYKDYLGIDSFDLKGARMNAYVHIGRSYVNAFWDGSSMNFGDGDGKTAGPLTTIDIAAHEITHGLTEHTADLIYSGESGGLNEAFSDIGGFLAEYYATQKNPGLTWDWAVGEDCWTPGVVGDALRYMDNPTSDGYSVDHYSKYPEQTEVHGSSGIANNAFYQLAEPKNEGKIPNSVSKIAVQDGIGVEKAGKIFFRALQFYMTSGSTFAQARAATIRAAIDLFGASSVEVKKVKEAWSAVGVEDAKPTAAGEHENVS